MARKSLEKDAIRRDARGRKEMLRTEKARTKKPPQQVHLKPNTDRSEYTKEQIVTIRKNMEAVSRERLNYSPEQAKRVGRLVVRSLTEKSDPFEQL